MDPNSFGGVPLGLSAYGPRTFVPAVFLAVMPRLEAQALAKEKPGLGKRQRSQKNGPKREHRAKST